MAHKYTFKQVEQYIKDNTLEIHIQNKSIGCVTTNDIEDAIKEVNKMSCSDITLNKEGDYVCKRSQFRSLGDTFMLLNYHWKPTSLEDLFKALVNMAANKQVQSWYCKDIYKRIWFMQNMNSNAGFTGVSDEYGFDYDSFNLPKSDYDYYYSQDTKFHQTVKI